MKILTLTKLEVPDLMMAANALPKVGRLACNLDGYAYLDIDNDFIHQLFPLLPKRKKLKKPNYFTNKKVGAHISVIYPEEKSVLAMSEIGQEHFFEIHELFTSVLDNKRYYILTVKADSLLALRKRYTLADMLTIKNHLVNFHITIAVSPI